MTILSKPVASSSHRAWEGIAGGFNSLVVQKRTAEGLETNERFSHRLFYKPTDLYPFRIIYSEDTKDFESADLSTIRTPKVGGPSASSPATSADKRRLVVAVADTSDEILKDWNLIKQAWSIKTRDGLVNISEWEEFFQSIETVREEEEKEEEQRAARNSLSATVLEDTSSKRQAGGDGGGRRGDGFASAANFSPLFRTEDSIKNEKRSKSFEGGDEQHDEGVSSQNTSFIHNKEDATAVANSTSGCTDSEVWVARIIGAWKWRDVYQSSLLAVLFLMPWMNWLVAAVVLYLAGLNLPRYRKTTPPTSAATPAEDDKTASSSGGMTGDEVRETVQWMNKALGLIGMRDIKSFLASVVLLNYISSIWLPPQLRLLRVLETYGCPAVSISLILGLVFRIFFSRSKNGKSKKICASESVAAGLKIDLTLASSSAPRAAASPEPARPSSSTTGAVSSSGAAAEIAAIPEEIVINASFNNTPGWTLSTVKDNVRFEKMKSPFCNKDACRFTINVPKSSPAALAAILSDDPEFTNPKAYAFQFDRLLEKRRIVERLEPGRVVCQNFFKSPVWGIGARDMVPIIATRYLTLAQQKHLRLRPASAGSDDEMLAVWVQGGLDKGKEHPVCSGYVRGAVHRYLLMGQEEKDGSVTITLMVSVDPQGGIPAWAVAQTNELQIEKLTIMAKLVTQLGPIAAPPLAQDVPAAAAASSLKGEEVEAEADATDLASVTVDPIIERWATELYHAKDWAKQVSNSEGVEFFLKPVPWSDKVAVRVSMFVPKVKAHALDRVINNLTLVPKFDRLIKDKVKVKDVSETRALFYSRYNSPVWGIAARDFVALTVPSTYLSPQQQRKLRVVPPGADRNSSDQPPVVFIHGAEDAGKDMPPAEKFQRGAVHLYAFMAQEVGRSGGFPDDGVLLTNCTSADPCGKIPSSIVNSTNAEQVEKLKIVAKLMQDISKAA